jgi:hypothetical protein
LTGEAMPPEEVFLRAVDLVIEEPRTVTKEFSEQGLRWLVVKEVSGL